MKKLKERVRELIGRKMKCRVATIEALRKAEYWLFQSRLVCPDIEIRYGLTSILSLIEDYRDKLVEEANRDILHAEDLTNKGP